MASVFPSLVTLHAARNAIDFLQDVPLQDTITTINLQNNELVTLSDVASLSKLTNLRSLDLKFNSIKSILPSPSGDSTQKRASVRFPSTLSTLDLSYNAIDSWTIIDFLPSIFPGLTSLRISHNPLYQSLSHPDGRYLSPADGYSLTIARSASLTELNHSPVRQAFDTASSLFYFDTCLINLRQIIKSLHEVDFTSRPSRCRNILSLAHCY